MCGNKKPHEHCGCCGREIPRCDGLPWCGDCLNHIAPVQRGAPWDRTYFALHGTACPFEKKE